MKNHDLLVLVSIFSLLGLAAGEIKDLKISGDFRPLILFEKFGFTSAGVANVAVSEATFSSIVSHPDPSLFGFFLLSSSNLIQTLAFESQQNPNSNPSCILSSPYIRLLFTFRDLSPPPFSAYNRSFPVSFPDDYNLFFANCAPETEVSMNVRTVLYNARPDRSRDYLSVGESPIPSVCFAFSLVFLAFLGIWIRCLSKNRSSAYQIHYLMGGLLLAKSLNLLFRAEDQHYIRVTGTPHGWDVLFYLFQFIKGILLFTVIVLIGTGWSFLKPFMQDREKKVLMLVIPLQVVTNVASIVIGETGPFIQDWAFWMQLFLLVDVVCCCAILFPIVWSIRSLRAASKSDGKAAKNLAKLVLFRKFYLVLIGYLYFTRVAVFALNKILSYKYKWAIVVAEEGVTLAFYVLMFYMFRPKLRNEYFVLDDEEEAAAMVALKDGDFDI